MGVRAEIWKEKCLGWHNGEWAICGDGVVAWRRRMMLDFVGRTGGCRSSRLLCNSTPRAPDVEVEQLQDNLLFDIEDVRVVRLTTLESQ